MSFQTSTDAFKVYRGTEEKIRNTRDNPIRNGHIYFAYDSDSMMPIIADMRSLAAAMWSLFKLQVNQSLKAILVYMFSIDQILILTNLQLTILFWLVTMLYIV